MTEAEKERVKAALLSMQECYDCPAKPVCRDDDAECVEVLIRWIMGEPE